MTKTVLITGASSGIGLATGNYLVEQGYRVLGTSRIGNKCNGKFEMLKLNVCDEHSVNQGVEAALKKMGGIDILINNAGIALVGSAEETDPDQIYQQLDTNFLGMARMVRAVLPHMRKQNSGQIINISSLVGFAAIPYTSAYSASKFAVEGYSEALYHELLPLGIHVAIVQPGMVKTSFFKHGGDIKNAIQDYAPWHQTVMQEITAHSERGMTADVVAEKVASLCRMKKPPLINRVGSDAKLVARLKRFMPKEIFNRIWHREFGLNRVKPVSKCD